MFKIIIAGSRNFSDFEKLHEFVIKKLFELNSKYKEHNLLLIDRKEKKFKINQESIEIISGTAKGADSLGIRFAKVYNLKLIEFPAEWKNFDVIPCKIATNSKGQYNMLAGHNRNEKMAKYAISDDCKGVLFLFWDGKSKGSKNMKSNANKYGLEIYEYVTK